MSESDMSESHDGPMVLQADLSPADAAEARDALIAAMTAAGEAKAALILDVEGEGGTPCALQLLVAAKRSAEAASVEMNLSEKAGALLARVHAD